MRYLKPSAEGLHTKAGHHSPLSLLGLLSRLGILGRLGTLAHFGTLAPFGTFGRLGRLLWLGLCFVPSSCHPLFTCLFIIEPACVFFASSGEQPEFFAPRLLSW